MRRRDTRDLCVFAAVLLLGLNFALAGDVDARDALLSRAQKTLREFAVDPAMHAMRDRIKDANAVLVVPQGFTGGLVLGSRGDEGVLIARREGDVTWSDPVIYEPASPLPSLHVGGQMTEIVVLAMTHRGQEALLNGAVAPEGVETADFLVFARGKGAFHELKLERFRPAKTSGQASGMAETIRLRRSIAEITAASR